MDRFPHKCLIQAPPEDNNNPYLENIEYADVFSGHCNCFRTSQSTYSMARIAECDYCVSIPNGRMPEIGENYKICIKLPQVKSDNEWNVIGYVKDFMRYDRNCLIYFQSVKGPMIESDIP